MWTRQELKSNAKKSLSGSYGMALLVTVITMILSGSSNIFNFRMDNRDMQRFAAMDVAWATLLENVWVQLIIASISLAVLVGIFFRIFVSTVIQVGESRWFSRNRESKPTPSIGQMFSLFQGSNWLPTVGAMLWMYFWLWLWSLLPLIPIIAGAVGFVLYLVMVQPMTPPPGWDWGQSWRQEWNWDSQTDRFNYFRDIAPEFFRANQPQIIVALVIASVVLLLAALLLIPAVVKGYAYRMTPWILADNPRIGCRRALKLSNRMTRGHKFEMFVLDLSFIGWYLLGLLVFFVGVIFVRPYYKATIAELYAVLRKNTVDQGMASMDEFGFRSVVNPATTNVYPSNAMVEPVFTDSSVATDASATTDASAASDTSVDTERPVDDDQRDNPVIPDDNDRAQTEDKPE